MLACTDWLSLCLFVKLPRSIELEAIDDQRVNLVSGALLPDNLTDLPLVLPAQQKH
jgi:hypothetical protein